MILPGGACLGAEHGRTPGLPRFTLEGQKSADRIDRIWESSSDAQAWLALTISTDFCSLRKSASMAVASIFSLKTIPGEIIRLIGNTHAAAVGLWIFQICHAARIYI